MESWDCIGAKATFCTEKDCNTGDKYYSGWNATNNDTRGLGIKWVEVEETDDEWIDAMWTVFEDEDCKGRSAILPIQYGM